MVIYVTGDIHGDGSAPQECWTRCMDGKVTDADTLVICGDVACLWSTRPSILPTLSAHDVAMIKDLTALR